MTTGLDDTSVSSLARQFDDIPERLKHPCVGRPDMIVDLLFVFRMSLNVTVQEKT